MARPKAVFTGELAERAKADLARIEDGGVAVRLKAIAAAARRPVSTVGDVLRAAPETVWRWARAYSAGRRRGPPAQGEEAQAVEAGPWAEGRGQVVAARQQDAKGQARPLDAGGAARRDHRGVRRAPGPQRDLEVAEEGGLEAQGAEAQAPQGGPRRPGGVQKKRQS